MHLTILHTSIGRPTIAFDTACRWLDAVREASGQRVQYVLGIEEQEIPLYTDTLVALQERYGQTFRVRFFRGPKITREQMLSPGFQWPPREEIPQFLTFITKASRLANESFAQGTDWVVTAADNLFPVEGWNVLLQPFLQTERASLLGYENQTLRSMVSHPLMNWKFFEKQNYSIMHPEYVHICADVDLYAVGMLSETLHALPPTLNPTHNHPLKNGNPPAGDDTFKLTNSQVVYWQGEPVLKARLLELSEFYGKPSPI